MDASEIRSYVDRWAPHVRFDRWAPRYDRSVLQRLLFGPTHAAVLTAAAAAGARPREVLDLGCGTGRLIELAADRWPEAHLIGIDLSSPMIAEARRKHAGDERFRFEVANAAALPLEPESVDVAFSTISFHHWADQAGGMREVARVLQADGLFVLADIRPPFVLRPVMRSFHEESARVRLFQDAGFSVVDQHRPARLGGYVLLTVGRKALRH